MLEVANYEGISIRPLTWTVDKIKYYHEMLLEKKVFSDDMPKALEDFANLVYNTVILWYEVTDDSTGVVCGLMYVTDLIPMQGENRFMSASWHATTWGIVATPKVPLARMAIQYLFRTLGLHRLEVQVPLRAGGAIRIAKKKIGFVEEGVRRQAYRQDGTYWDVLVLSLLEDEVAQWETSSVLSK